MKQRHTNQGCSKEGLQTRPVMLGRLVGDPIDIVSGANIDKMADFLHPGPISLDWDRHYDSAHHTIDRGLGFGFRHRFDRELFFDIDGMCYVDESGQETCFPFFDRDGQVHTKSGVSIRRVTELCFLIKGGDGLTGKFVFTDVNGPAPLGQLEKDNARVTLTYNNAGRLRSLRSNGHLLDVIWEGEHIDRVVLQDLDGARQRLVKYHYSPSGHLLKTTDLLDLGYQYEYDKAGRVTKKTDRRGYSFLFEYDKRGRCLHSMGEDGVEDVRLEYLPDARQTIVTKANGGTWLYTYAPNGAITQIVDPYGATTIFELDDQGNPISETDAEGVTSRYLFNDLGAPISKVDELGRVRDLGEPRRSHNPLMPRGVGRNPLEWEQGAIVKLGYDAPEAKDRPAILPNEVISQLRTRSELGGKPEEKLDLSGLKLSEELKTGQKRAWAYDANGNVRKSKDFDGVERSTEFASWNHPVVETDPLGGKTFLEWNSSEHLVRFTDPGGTKSEYTYDFKDRLTEVYRHGKLRERYEYDRTDNLVAKRDTHGKLLAEYDRDRHGLMTSINLSTGENFEYTYDHLGHLKVAKHDEESCSFIHNAEGFRRVDLRDGLGVIHLTSMNRLRSTGLLDRFLTRYAYPDKQTVFITDPTGETHRIRDLGFGLVLREFSNGLDELAQYNVFGDCLLKVAFDRESQETSWERRYERSAEGFLRNIGDNLRGDRRIEHDGAHRLSKIRHSDGRVDEYEYDEANNLLRKPGLTEGIVASHDGESYDISKVVLDDGNRLKRANGDEFLYDHRDHITSRKGSKGQTNYNRDAQGRLREITGPDIDWHADYDPLGRRTHKRVGDLQWTYYWDNERLAAEIDPHGRVRLYLYPDAYSLVPILFIDYESIEADPKSGRRYFVLCNHLGAPEKILNDDRKTVWSATIEPYGECTIRKGHDFHQPLRFPGHYFDAETGLHCNRFRYYSPELGRYLESDPAGITGGDNLYAYTTNPLRYVDVSGLTCGDSDGTRGDSEAEGTVRAPAPDVPNERRTIVGFPAPPRRAMPIESLNRFPPRTRELAAQSGTLRSQLDRLQSQGWSVMRGPAGGGSFADRRNRRIVIAQGMTPEREVSTIAHEAGHAEHGSPTRHRMEDCADRSDYINRNLNENMQDEGAAQFNAARVRQEIQQTDGTDIGMPGSGDYNSTFDRYNRGEINRDQAVTEMGNTMRNESTSTTGQNYTDYYGNRYGNQWDTVHGSGSSSSAGSGTAGTGSAGSSAGSAGSSSAGSSSSSAGSGSAGSSSSSSSSGSSGDVATSKVVVV